MSDQEPAAPKPRFKIRDQEFDLEERVVWHVPGGRTGKVVGVSGSSLIVLTSENFVICVSLDDIQRFH